MTRITTATYSQVTATIFVGLLFFTMNAQGVDADSFTIRVGNATYAVDTEHGAQHAQNKAILASQGVDTCGNVSYIGSVAPVQTKTTRWTTPCDPVTNTKSTYVKVKKTIGKTKLTRKIEACSVPSTPPTDMCPNIAGVQTLSSDCPPRRGADRGNDDDDNDPRVSTCTADSWSCGAFGTCTEAGVRTRSCYKEFDCPNVDTPMPNTSMSCSLDAACVLHNDDGTCPPPPVITEFKAVPSLIPVNGQCTLSWKANDAEECTITSVKGTMSNLPEDGSRLTGALTESVTYTLVCENGSLTSAPAQASCRVQDVEEN